MIQLSNHEQALAFLDFRLLLLLLTLVKKFFEPALILIIASALFISEFTTTWTSFVHSRSLNDLAHGEVND